MIGRSLSRRNIKTQVWPAPKEGWVRNQALLGAKGAEVLENIFPTAEGARVRRGATKHGTITGAVKSLLVWRGSTEKLFAASASAIYPLSAPADVDVSPTADITGLSNGDWSQVMFATSGGVYLVIANGADSVRHYNGTAWATPAITVATSSTLSQVWAFKTRLFFVQKNTLSAWYLPTLAVAGAATELPLRGIFKRGGVLLFGATWSLDSGSGIDDVCIFVTDQGEIAVYEGTDPSSASTWSLAGVYQIGKPLGKNAWFQAGGDLMLMTEDGIISVSEALRKDRAALMAAALTYPIEDEWREAITNRDVSYTFSCVLWQSQTMLVIGAPTLVGTRAYVANARTGAWSSFTGWDVQCGVVWNDQYYFGNSDGYVIAGDVGGTDNGTTYTGKWVPKFIEAGGFMSALHAKVAVRSDGLVDPRCQGFTDYALTDWESASPSSFTADASLWGTFVWGTDTWGSSETAQASTTRWQAINGTGTALSAGVQVAIGSVSELNVDLIALHMQYEPGRFM